MALILPLGPSQLQVLPQFERIIIFNMELGAHKSCRKTKYKFYGLCMGPTRTQVDSHSDSFGPLRYLVPCLHSCIQDIGWTTKGVGVLSIGHNWHSCK